MYRGLSHEGNPNPPKHGLPKKSKGKRMTSNKTTGGIQKEINRWRGKFGRGISGGESAARKLL